MNTIKNNITLVGNMGTDAFITNFENGNKVARFSIATRNHDGSAEDATKWHRVFAWGSVAGYLEQYGKKGRKIAVHGRLVNRTYLTKKGIERKVTEVEIKHIIGM